MPAASKKDADLAASIGNLRTLKAQLAEAEAALANAQVNYDAAQDALELAKHDVRRAIDDDDTVDTAAPVTDPAPVDPVTTPPTPATPPGPTKPTTPANK